MRSFLLIFKNNWKNITKLKGVFILLFLIILLFSTSITFFWEFERQFSTNITESKIKQSDFDFISSYRQGYVSAEKNLFCTDYTAINDETTRQNRRFAALTFNDRDGCFKALDYDKLKVSYVTGVAAQFKKFQKGRKLPTNYEQQTHVFAIDQIRIPRESFVFNTTSKYYQNSIHGRLMDKFRTTRDTKYLQHAQWIEDTFLPKLAKYMATKIKFALNQKLTINSTFTYQEPYKLIGKIMKTSLKNMPLKLLERQHQPDAPNFSYLAYKYRELFGDLITRIDLWNQHWADTEFLAPLKTTILATNPPVEQLQELFTTLGEKVANFQKQQTILNSIPDDENFNQSFILNSVVNAKNYSRLIYIIKKMVVGDQKFFAKYQTDPGFQQLIQFLILKPKAVLKFTHQFLFNDYPLFEIFTKLQDAQTYLDAQTPFLKRSEQLKYFNFNNQTAAEILDNLNRTHLLQRRKLLYMIDQIYSNFHNHEVNNFFNQHIHQLQAVERQIFANNQLTAKILAVPNNNLQAREQRIVNFYSAINNWLHGFKTSTAFYARFFSGWGLQEPVFKPNDYRFLTDGSAFAWSELKQLSNPQPYLAGLADQINLLRNRVKTLIEKLVIPKMLNLIDGKEIIDKYDYSNLFKDKDRLNLLKQTNFGDYQFGQDDDATTLYLLALAFVEYWFVAEKFTATEYKKEWAKIQKTGFEHFLTVPVVKNWFNQLVNTRVNLKKLVFNDRTKTIFWQHLFEPPATLPAASLENQANFLALFPKLSQTLWSDEFRTAAQQNPKRANLQAFFQPARQPIDRLLPKLLNFDAELVNHLDAGIFTNPFLEMPGFWEEFSNTFVTLLREKADRFPQSYKDTTFDVVVRKPDVAFPFIFDWREIFYFNDLAGKLYKPFPFSYDGEEYVPADPVKRVDPKYKQIFATNHYAFPHSGLPLLKDRIKENYFRPFEFYYRFHKDTKNIIKERYFRPFDHYAIIYDKLPAIPDNAPDNVKKARDQEVLQMKELLQQTATEFNQKFITQEIRNQAYAYLFNLKNWRADNDFLNDAIALVMKDHDPNEETITYYNYNENKLIQIVGELYDVDFSNLQIIYFNNTKSGENHLVVALDKGVDVFLHEGFMPFKNNQIIISPLYAQYKNIKVGDKIAVANFDNLEVAGIGTSKRFVYPALNYINLIPSVKDNIIFTRRPFHAELEFELRRALNADFWFRRNYIFFNTATNFQNRRQYEQFLPYLGWNYSEMTTATNYTDFSKDLFPLNQKKHFGYQTYDNALFHTLTKTFSQFPFKLNFQIPLFIYQIVFYSFVYILTILSLITFFAIWYLLTKKIEINRKQIGILKALGYSDFSLLATFTSFFMFVVFATFLGWILGTVLQKPLFDLFSDKILFKFDYFYFSFYSFYFTLGVLFVFIFTILVVYNFTNFKKRLAVNLLQEGGLQEQNLFTKKIFLFFKNFVIGAFWKINYVLFTTVAQKILVLFLVVLFISINLLSIFFFVSVFYETPKKLLAGQVANWEFHYEAPTAGNPLSRLNFYTNYGLKGLIDPKLQKNNPFVDNLNIDMYLKDANGKYLNKQLSIAEGIALFYVLHNKVINYNKITMLLNTLVSKQAAATDAKEEREELNRLVCTILRNVLRRPNLNDQSCLKDILGRSIPFVVDPQNRTKIEQNFPIAFNNVMYNPTQDELFTLANGKLQANDETVFIVGLASQTRNLPVTTQVKNQLFATNPAKKVLPIVVSKLFADKNNIQLDDKFKLQFYRKQAYFRPTRNDFLTPLKDDHWVYYDIAANGQVTKQKLTALPYDWQFFLGRQLLKANDNLVNVPNEYLITNLDHQGVQLKKLELYDAQQKTYQPFYPYYKTQRAGQTTYRPLINVENIGLEVNGQTYWPYRMRRENEDERFNKFHDWIIEQKITTRKVLTTPRNTQGQEYEFRVIGFTPKFDRSEVYLPQTFVNRTLGWKNAPTNNYQAPGVLNPNQYFNARFSSSEELFNAVFQFGLINKYGYIDISTVGEGRGSLITRVRNFELENKYKIVFLRFIFNIILPLILINILTALFLFGLIIKIIFDIFQKKTLLLRVFGFRNAEIVTQILLVTFLPVVVAFTIGAVICYHLFNLLQNYLMFSKQIYFFYISEPWIFIACFAVLLVIFMTIFLIYLRVVKRTDLQRFIK